MTSEQYLSLLHQIREAKELGLALPEEPRYDEITNGFKMKDRSNEEEPVLVRFSSWAEEAALELKKEIDASIRNRAMNKRIKNYYNKCLGYFRRCNTDDTIHFTYGERIELEFNDELMEAVFNAFKKASNKKKREIMHSFLNIKFSNYKDQSLPNKLIQRLNNLKNNDITDPIEIVNLDIFIKEIRQRFLLDEI